MVSERRAIHITQNKYNIQFNFVISWDIKKILQVPLFFSFSAINYKHNKIQILDGTFAKSLDHGLLQVLQVFQNHTVLDPTY